MVPDPPKLNRGQHLERMQFLVGISPAKLIRLLWQHRFRVPPRYWRDLGQLLFLSLLTSACNAGDRWRCGRELARTKITLPPVFIVGHWRSGTTLLHKLLSLDTAFCAPTFFECCLPRGFVSGRRILKPRIARHLPGARPSDAAPFGADEPFEDEFVLARETLVSPMLAAVFPESSAAYRRHLYTHGLTPRELECWRQTLMDFARKLTLVHGRRLLFKSPAHSCRIPELRQLFPGAKFIAMQRDPLDVIASTLRMEAELVRHNSLQRTAGAPDEAWILDRYLQVQAALDRARRVLPPADFTAVDYASLCNAPVTVLAASYARLGLEPPTDLQRTLAGYFAVRGHPRMHAPGCTPEQRARWQRWLAGAGFECVGKTRASVCRPAPAAA
ncbi:MAG: sulfotransferase family protein, partial [Gammaproteobacteria bacterium]